MVEIIKIVLQIAHATPIDLLTRYGTILVLSIVIVILMSVWSPSTYASRDSYDTGYDHGCDDAEISDPSDRYINHPGKGRMFLLCNLVKRQDSK